MAIDAESTFANTNNTAFPNTESVNASGPLATDGTEFVKALIDNYMFGPQQALLNYAGLTPNGVSESASNSQELEAMKSSFGYPGEEVNWYGSVDPSTVGAKILLLHGQGVLVANYQELTNTVYVGDIDNGTAEAFFRADDAAGTIRNTTGDYLILPDARGRVGRYLDTTGIVDPDGALRLVGDTQEDAFQGHWHDILNGSSQRITRPAGGGVGGTSNTGAAAPSLTDYMVAKDIVSDGINGTPRISSETRMKNISVRPGIRY